MYIAGSIVFVGIISVCLLFWWHFQEEAKCTEYGKKSAHGEARNDISTVIEVLNLLQNERPFGPKRNIKEINFKKGSNYCESVCEIEVKFSIDECPAQYNDTKQIATDIKNWVQDFFDDGLLLKKQESKDKYFTDHFYDEFYTEPKDVFYHKEIEPWRLCSLILKNRLDLVVFVILFKGIRGEYWENNYLERTFYGDYFRVLSHPYEEKMVQFEEAWQEYKKQNNWDVC